MTDIAYALLTLGSSSLWGFVSGWILYFYIPPTGTPLVPIALYSVVMFLAAASTSPSACRLVFSRIKHGRPGGGVCPISSRHLSS